MKKRVEGIISQAIALILRACGRRREVTVEERVEGILSKIRAFSGRMFSSSEQEKEVCRLYKELICLVGPEKASELCSRHMTPVLQRAITSTSAAA
ncbi:MAG: hypothetical protein M1324_02150 [Patescibacteria group bacterium]|nr:hypothetical protein [Patescibacteria group bacterium]